MSTQRSSFSGKIGFVLAAAGSAVGLGNIWRFPYLAAKYGGGMFLLTYIVLSLTFGFSLMIAEIAIGRKTQTSALDAYRKLNRRFGFVGVIASFVPIIILPYYSVIGGWVTKYAAGFLLGENAAMANGDYFSAYISSPWEPTLWFLFFITATVVIVLFGVQKGIEKISKVLMPALIAMTLFIAIYTICTMENALPGVLYYLTPDFDHFSVMTVVAAMGQLFYSMSLAMGIMITFGSYMKKDVHIEHSAHQIELFDTGVAFLTGLMIIPAVFSFSSGDPSAVNKGPGLMFITLPQIFSTMPGGRIIGLVFFLMVFFAALTSSISLMETVVSILMDKLKWRHPVCCAVTLGGCIVLGLLSVLGYSVWKDVLLFGKFPFLDFFDFITNSILMPFVALITCILVGYVVKPQSIADEVEKTGKFRAKKLFYVMIRYVAPVFLLAILVFSILDAIGVLVI